MKYKDLTVTKHHGSTKIQNKYTFYDLELNGIKKTVRVDFGKELEQRNKIEKYLKFLLDEVGEYERDYLPVLSALVY